MTGKYSFSIGIENFEQHKQKVKFHGSRCSHVSVPDLGSLCLLILAPHLASSSLWMRYFHSFLREQGCENRHHHARELTS